MTKSLGCLGTGRQHPVFQPRWPVLGVSSVWKNNPEAKTEANVETAALCNVDIDVFFWASEFALPTDPVGVQKPFLTLGGLNHVSLFIPILIISSDSLLFTVFQSKSSHT